MTPHGLKADLVAGLQQAQALAEAGVQLSVVNDGGYGCLGVQVKGQLSMWLRQAQSKKLLVYAIADDGGPAALDCVNQPLSQLSMGPCRQP